LADEFQFYFEGGTAAALAKLEFVNFNQPKQVEAAMYRLGERIMSISKDQYVPVRFSTLANSGHVDRPTRENGTIVVRLRFGGPSAPYALAVHEHLSMHSPPSWVTAEDMGHPVQFQPGGRGPKYLETPLMLAARTATRDLADDLRWG